MGRHQPALLGGLFIGVLGSLPFIKVANCCCLWVIVGGVLTTYLLQQRHPEPIETSDAVLAGLLAGLVGWALISIVTVIEVKFAGAMLEEQFDQVRSQLESNPDIPPGARDMIMNLITGRGLLFMIVGVTLPIYAVFAMLGALLGLAFFRKKVPPQAQA